MKPKDQSRLMVLIYATQQHQFTEADIRECQIQHSLDLIDEMVGDIGGTVMT